MGSLPASTARLRSLGSLDLNAKRLTTETSPKPALVEKPTIFRMVGSSTNASAVLGFSITQRMRRARSPDSTIRMSR
jgi:hypothetical protein